MKLDDIVNISKNLLKNGELNLRERANIYGGAIFGLLGPIVAARYLFFGLGYEESPEKEALKWVYSLAVAPSVALGLPLGIILGLNSAKSLKKARQERENPGHRRYSLTRVFDI